MKKRTESSLTQKAMQALADAVAKVVEEHRRQARPLAVWRDGKAVWISATRAAFASCACAPETNANRRRATLISIVCFLIMGV